MFATAMDPAIKLTFTDTDHDFFKFEKKNQIGFILLKNIGNEVNFWT